jgi:hypothetical protein
MKTLLAQIADPLFPVTCHLSPILDCSDKIGYSSRLLPKSFDLSLSEFRALSTLQKSGFARLE